LIWIGSGFCWVSYRHGCVNLARTQKGLNGPKRGKRYKKSCFEELDILFKKLEAFIILQKFGFSSNFSVKWLLECCDTCTPVLRVRILDAVPFDPWIRDPGWVKKNQDPDPGSVAGMKIPDHISESFETSSFFLNAEEKNLGQFLKNY
jgi:hypothetical protein